MRSEVRHALAEPSQALLEAIERGAVPATTTPEVIQGLFMPAPAAMAARTP